MGWRQTDIRKPASPAGETPAHAGPIHASARIACTTHRGVCATLGTPGPYDRREGLGAPGRVRHTWNTEPLRGQVARPHPASLRWNTTGPLRG